MGFRAESATLRTLRFPTLVSAMNNQAANTIMAWFYVRTMPVGDYRLFSNSTTNATQTKAAVQLFTNGSLTAFARRITGDAVVQINSAAGLVSAGSWNHVALVLNWAGGQMLLYLNGVLVANTSPAGWVGNAEAADSATNYLGSLDNTSGVSNADYHDYRFYRRAVSGAELSAIRAAQGGDRVRLSLFYRLLLNNGVPGAVIGNDTVREYTSGVLAGTPTNSAQWCSGLRTGPAPISL